MDRIDAIKLFKVFLILSLFFLKSFAKSNKKRFLPIKISGVVNSSSVFSGNKITGNMLNIYRPEIGVETSLRLFNISDTYDKVKLKFSIFHGGFDNRLENQNLDYNITKKYRINYLRISVLYPISKPKTNIHVVSGIYLGLPISSNYKLYKNSFISYQDSKKINSSWLKNDFGFENALIYDINKNISVEASMFFGIKNSFYNKREFYKTRNKTISLGLSYLIEK